MQLLTLKMHILKLCRKCRTPYRNQQLNNGVNFFVRNKSIFSVRLEWYIKAVNAFYLTLF